MLNEDDCINNTIALGLEMPLPNVHGPLISNPQSKTKDAYLWQNTQTFLIFPIFPKVPIK